ncbi:hypothetical protein NPIL_64691 [Nephila pilipes]|uniref:Uncharacterized protein n=1 Tax=Nephila pilipes TaxID=299642 RepID=A0A8X6TF90_NEPPI|nr:hypothetical protein NPIL_64691 [Nephila pilipes]
MEEKVFEALNAISVEPRGSDALEILLVTSFIAPGIISSEVLSSVITDPERLISATELLDNHSLIHSVGNGDFILKKSVQSIVRTFMKELTIETNIFFQSLEKLIGILMDSKNVNHVICILNHALDYEILHGIVIKMRDWVLFTLMEQNRYQEAYEFSKMALNFLRNKLGATHGTTLDFQYNITILLGRMGKFAEAAKLLMPILKENVRSFDQKEMLITRHALARHLVEQSKYQEALAVYEQLIDGEDISEATDTIVLTTWCNYALLLIDMGKYSEAFDILQNTLNRRIEISNADVEDISEIRQLMAYTLVKQNRYTKALEIFEDVLYDRAQFFGELHLKTLLTKRNLAIIFAKQGEHDKALLIYLEVFNKLKQTLGDSHPETLTTRGNIATVLANKGEQEKAYEIYTDVYEKFKITLGERCKESLCVKLNIGLSLSALGKSKEALKALQEVYEDYNYVFGSNHDNTKEVKTLIDVLQICETLSNSATESRDTNKNIDATDVCDQDYKRKWPLHYAAKNSDVSNFKEFLKKGALYSEKDCSNNTPLRMTSNQEIRHLLILVKRLFKDVKVRSSNNIAEYITENSSIINARDNNGYTPLHWAACHGHQSIVQQLLEVGADVSLTSRKGNTPLHIAVSKGHREIVELMLQNVKASQLKQVLNAKTTISGSAALHVAAQMGHLDISKCLLKHGATYDISNKKFETPWHVARDPTVCNFLGDICDLFSQVKEGNESALSRLKRKESDEIVAITRAHNCQDHTLVQVANMNDHQDIARELIKIDKEYNQLITGET